MRFSSVPKPHWIVPTHYRVRAVSFAYAFLFCALHLWDGAYSFGYWAFSALQFLLYPHLAYWRAVSAPDTQKAELQNLLLDNVFLGGWSAALGFPLWITFTLFITSAINCAISLGRAGLIKSIAIFAGGSLLGMVIYGLPVPGTDNPLVTFLCVPGVSVYLMSIGHIAFKRTLSLRKVREKLKQSEADLQRSNDVLHHQLGEIQTLQAQLQEHANRDPLTGLYNRRYLQTTLERELARCHRDGLPLSLMIVDIDHFKSINDKFGHNAGDEVLRQLGFVLNEGARQEDVPCRYGGEEFVVLFPNMSTEIALKRGEQLRAAFEQTVVASAHGNVNTTISMGVATFPMHGASMDELTHCADLALYAVKRNGRNGVLAFNDVLDARSGAWFSAL
ncbi:MAG: diguanylate cyclase [Rhodoferax sp.]|nr:diguanylate cyclase [Rhodoferax sp.]